MDSGWTFCPISSALLGCQENRQAARALADRRGAPHGARPEPLERRALVGGDREDLQVVAEQLVVVLRVRDGRLEQLAPVARDVAGRERQDRARLDDGLAADVVAHQARLAGGGADVLGVGAHGDALALGRTGAGARRARRRLGGLLGLLGLRRGLLRRRLLLGGGLGLSLGVGLRGGRLLGGRLLRRR